MKCRVDKTKLCVDNVLKNNSVEDVDIYLLCDDDIEKANDVFNYLIELISNLKENSTNDYIIKIITGMISYVELCNEIKYELSDSEKNSILKIKDQYLEFLKKYNIESNDNIIEKIEILRTTLENNTLSENEKVLLNKCFDLTKAVKNLESKLTALTVKTKLYEDKVTKFEEKDKKLEKTNQDLTKSIKDIKEQLQKLQKQYDIILKEKELLEQSKIDGNNEIVSLKNKIEEITIINSELTKQVLLFESQLQELTNKLDEYIKLEEKKSKEKELDNLILSKLFEDEYTIFGLYTSLKNEGYSYTREEISESLKRIKNNIKKKVVPITYQVSQPLVTTNGTLEINNVTRKYSLLVTADWHISTNIEIAKTLSVVDSLYNYCESNNIGLIVNLGDFLDVKSCDTRYMQYCDNMKLLDSIIELFPKDKNIIHAILGGNHDRRMLNLGIDPLKYLEDNRRDFINLGYDDATIYFMKDNISEFIGLHHPGSLNYGLEVPEMQEFVSAYLKNVYKDNDISKKDVYMDLFGHYHKNIIDGANHYALVPALMKMNGKSPNGAYHFEVYFNEDNTINYILIKSIMPDRMHEPISEYVYQKKKN